jgi:rhamnosyltransferase
MKGIEKLGSIVRIAGVVVFYNPAPDFIDNIDSYIDEVETVYVIDNSEFSSPEICDCLDKNPKISYVWNGDNLGIAAALNIGVELAARAGFNFVLTMDQDSHATPGMVATMLDCLNRFEKGSVGIVSPYHQLCDILTPPPGECHDVEVTMASGNLLDLNAFRKTGPFREDYFIDYVDHEYCLRLRQKGYRIVMANQAILKHRLGAMSWHSFLWKRTKVGNHPPLRRYYAFRNRFHLHRLFNDTFPVYFKYFYLNIIQDIVGVILFEKLKSAKLTMMWRGYMDYRRGVYGRFMERHKSS